MNMKQLLNLFEKFFIPLFFLFASFLVLFEYSYGTNSVLNLFKIDYVDTFALALTLLIVSIFRVNRKNEVVF